MRYLTRPSYLPKKFSPYAFLFGLLLICSAGLVACGTASTSAPLPTPTPPQSSTPQPIATPQTTPTPGMLEKSAPIESVAIEVSATELKLADLVVVSGLPNACYTFGHYSLGQKGNTYHVEIVNLIPDDPMLACAEIYGMITTRIPLQGGVETCASYPVIVNGESYMVQAIAPNVRCADPSSEASNEVTLVFGDKAVFRRTDLELTLIDVTEDSRCPSDVTCVWAGRATAVIKVEMYGNELGRVFLTLGGDDNSNLAPIGNYTIELINLEPYPVSTKEIAAEDYVARVAVTQG